MSKSQTILLLGIIIIIAFSCSRRKVFTSGYFTIGVSNGVLDNPDIDEASGLVASKTNKGLIWINNDSGDKARLFLVDEKGRHRATIYLEGIENRDWEDIAIGPGPIKGRSYVYVGEIGDNNASYSCKYIYRFEEPSLNIRPEDSPIEKTVPMVEKIKITLPDGERDSEALLVDPLTQDIYIFSKREADSIHVYQLNISNKRMPSYTPTRVMKLPYVQLTAADISPDGTEILLKNYQHVYYWMRSKSQSIIAALKKKPVLLPYATEPQGEAIGFDLDGRGYYTVSESVKNKKPHLMFYARQRGAAIKQP